MKIDYTLEHFEQWKSFHSILFERKLINETAFDGIVKIYSLKSSDEKLNNILENMFFGNFFYPTSDGIFLRQFDNRDSWPKTTLVFLDLKKEKLIKVKRTKSSWDIWTGFDLGSGKYSIEISPQERIEYQT